MRQIPIRGHMLSEDTGNMKLKSFVSALLVGNDTAQSPSVTFEVDGESKPVTIPLTQKSGPFWYPGYFPGLRPGHIQVHFTGEAKSGAITITVLITFSKDVSFTFEGTCWCRNSAERPTNSQLDLFEPINQQGSEVLATLNTPQRLAA